MTFRAIIRKGQIEFPSARAAIAWRAFAEGHEGKYLTIEEEKQDGEKPRTEQQNRAIHTYCELVAEALNEGGLTIEQTVKNFTMELNWTKESVKELLWRTAQKRLLGKTSTKELNKHEDVTRVYEAVNRFLAKLGVHVPFPSHDAGYWDSAPLKTDV